MKILIAGDFCPRDRVATMVANKDYSFFDGVKDIIKEADYSIVNFECPVVEGDVKPIAKCGPVLRTERTAVAAMKYAGFNCATLANNHFRDFGDSGCLTTIEELEAQNIDYVGGGKTLAEAQKVLYKDIQGKKVAFVNFCENEFSIATATTAGAAPLDSIDKLPSNHRGSQKCRLCCGDCARWPRTPSTTKPKNEKTVSFLCGDWCRCSCKPSSALL